MDHDQNPAQDLTSPINPRRAMLAGVAGLAAGALFTSRAGAGDLAPPTGPIAPTMKPLDQIEPRTALNQTNTPLGGGGFFQITQPGSYYLANNINFTGAFGGITIAADNVTIDLMGFELRGNSQTFQSAIQLPTGTGTRRNIVIRNGIIRDWTNSNSLGLKLLEAENCIIENLILFNNRGGGVQIGPRSVIRHCTTGNSASGIGFRISSECVIHNCASQNNSNAGIAADTRCTILENTISGNSGGGVTAVSDGLITNNNIINNRNASNQGAGIRVTGAGNRIEANNMVLQAPGIEATGGGNLIIRNSLRATNPPFSLAAGNTTGPTVTSANIASSNNPHANYTF